MTDARHPGYERRDVQPSSVAWMVIGFFGGIAASAGLVAALIGLLSREAAMPPTTPSTVQPASPSSPRLEVPEGKDRGQLEQAAQHRLQGYAWVDRDAGRVRIPIEDAMSLLVQRGWPDKAAP